MEAADPVCSQAAPVRCLSQVLAMAAVSRRVVPLADNSMKPFLITLSFFIATITWATEVNLSSLNAHDSGDSPEFTTGDIIIADFVAPWCGSCLKESPRLQTLIKGLQRDDLQFLAINIDQSNPTLTRHFIKRSKLNALWEDHGAEIYQSVGGNSGVPFVALGVIHNTRGEVKIKQQWLGHVDPKELLAAIDTLTK